MSASDTPSETRVLYNASCPVCAFEIDHYRARADRDALPLRFDDLNGPELAAWGLDADTAAKRLHVLSNGELLTGLNAFRAIWQQMPRMRWLATLTGFRVVHGPLSWVYDRVGAPLLYRAHKRRMAKRRDAACSQSNTSSTRQS
ncbi:hypothetical protein JANAI62_06730 [Jannaschia pagri]|uniref:DUF393 domain-containing protein n=1 Tax=Jannaschia pagri TaxID=2829797 RepID=A0ABQ4NIL1_9RHOB|nr:MULTISPECIES: DUF393 domain-containing protein [unclassified Jannaschia]GIT89843.1 hypothetical protein JANAI61_03010 [Jannaschia sp. AI_61]GIT94050.1 hypothetical protein JANAI62_06730 [Jannaschia sp. AI_62]